MIKVIALMSLLFLMATTFVCAQDYLEEDPILNEEETIYREEGSTFTEINPPVSDEVPNPEIERQEDDLLYPESDNSDLNLENEELHGEDWE